MRISEMNWMQVENFLKLDDRCVLPLGSTEQHAYLSLSVDSILAERVACWPMESRLIFGLTLGVSPCGSKLI